MRYRKIVGIALSVACLGVAHGASAAYDAVSPKAYNRLCPTKINGDREYAGHGPHIKTWVTLRKSGAQVLLDVYMNQRENAPDWSEAEYNSTFLLSQAPDGANYNAIWAPNSAGVWAWVPMGDSPWQTFKEEYDDGAHDLKLTTDTGFSWLAEVDTNGDTAGNDIGNCTADDAYLNVRTNPIYVQY